MEKVSETEIPELLWQTLEAENKSFRQIGMLICIYCLWLEGLSDDYVLGKNQETSFTKAINIALVRRNQSHTNDLKNE